MVRYCQDSAEDSRCLPPLSFSVLFIIRPISHFRREDDRLGCTAVSSLAAMLAPGLSHQGEKTQMFDILE